MKSKLWRGIIGLVTVVGLFFCQTAVGSNRVEAQQGSVERHEVVIVGGGISGLTSGYYLKKSDMVILEKKAKVGGRTISGVHNAFTYAKGTEYIGEPESILAQMIKELKLSPKQIPSPMDGYFDGKAFFYGGEGLKRHLVTKSSATDYAKFIRLIMTEFETYDEIPNLEYTSRHKYLDGISARQWLINNKVAKVLIDKYNVASKGLFGASLDEISALSFLPEAAFDYYKDWEENLETESDAYFDYDAADIEDEYIAATKESSGSYSFEKGLTELTDALGRVLSKKIRLNSTVTNIVKKGNEYWVTYTDGKGAKKVIAAKKVVLAVAAPEALRIAPTLFTKEKRALMQAVTYASYATVAMFSKEPIFNKAFDLAVPDDYYFTDVYDATWVERHYAKNKQQQDYIISVYVAPKTYKDHSLDVIPDQEIIANVNRDLDKIFRGASAKITGYDIERFQYAYPVMTVGAYKRLLRLNALNTGSFILAGDYMVYPTFEAAIQSGYLAAKRIGLKK